MKNKDFTVHDLPSTRKELFFDILKHRLSTLIRLGWILVLCSLPYIVTTFLFNLFINEVQNSNLPDKEMYQQLIATINFRNLLYIICSIFLSLGLGGIFQIIRRLLFNEDILFKVDFKKGMKENFRHIFLVFFILNVLYFVISLLIYEHLYLGTNYANIIVGLTIAAFILFSAIALTIFNSTTIYNLRFIDRMKNGFIFLMSKFFILIPLTILNLSMLLLHLIPNSTSFVLSLFLLPLLAPILILINMLIIDSIFDEYVNKTNHPEIYRKGMAPLE